jgi:hypothetical protein
MRHGCSNKRAATSARSRRSGSERGDERCGQVEAVGEGTGDDDEVDERGAATSAYESNDDTDSDLGKGEGENGHGQDEEEREEDGEGGETPAGGGRDDSPNPSVAEGTGKRTAK